jgi:hypothetical protein
MPAPYRFKRTKQPALQVGFDSSIPQPQPYPFPTPPPRPQSLMSIALEASIVAAIIFLAVKDLSKK